MSSTRNYISAQKVYASKSLINKQVGDLTRKTNVTEYADWPAAQLAAKIGDFYTLTGYTENIYYYAGPDNEPATAINMVLSVQTTSTPETVTLGSADYGSTTTITWGDGQSSTASGVSAPTHEYASPGIYTVTLKGTITGFAYGGGAGATQLIEVQQFGELVTYGAGAFNGCSSLQTLSSVDIPVFDTTTSASFMFNGCVLLEDHDFSAWDVSDQTNFTWMFRQCTSLTAASDFSNWDISSATTTTNMFGLASSFKADLSTWTLPASGCVGSSMFNGTAYTGADVAAWGWDFTAFSNVGTMFSGCTSLTSMPFTDISAATTANGLFVNCTALAPSSVTLNLSAATNCGSVFSGCTSFNPTSMSITFNTVSTFTAASFFNNCTAFTGNDLDTLNLSMCTNLSNFCAGTAVTTANYDAALAAWAALSLQTGVTLGMGSATYTDVTNRSALLGFNDATRYYSFDNGGDTDILAVDSVAAANCVLTNCQLVSGVHGGNAVELTALTNGSGAFSASNSGLPLLNDSRTYSLWFKINDQTSHKILLNSHNTNEIIALLYVSSKMRLRWYNVIGDYYYEPADWATKFSTGVWHHVAITYDGSTRAIKFYYDNVDVTASILPSSTAASNLTTAFTSFNLFHEAGTNIVYSAGGVYALDQVAIFRYITKTSNGVNNLYNNVSWTITDGGP